MTKNAISVEEGDWKRQCSVAKEFRENKAPARDARFGGGQLMQHLQTGQKLFLRSRNTNNKAEAEKFISEAKRRLAVQGRGLATLHDFSVNVNSGFCGTSYAITEYWDYNTNDLEKEINKRANSNSGFSDKEITYLLYFSTLGLATLNDNKMNHGNITPLHIDVGEGNSDKSYKLVDPERRNDNPVQSTFTNISQGKELFTAPEIFNNLNQLRSSAEAAKKIDAEKAAAFSLGMTILRVGTMDSLHDCYDKKQGKFNVDVLQKHYQKFASYYHENLMLVDAVERLVDPDPIQRWNAQYLRSEFPLEEDIDICFEDDDDLELHPDQLIDNTPVAVKSGPQPYNQSIQEREHQNPQKSVPMSYKAPIVLPEHSQHNLAEILPENSQTYQPSRRDQNQVSVQTPLPQPQHQQYIQDRVTPIGTLSKNTYPSVNPLLSFSRGPGTVPDPRQSPIKAQISSSLLATTQYNNPLSKQVASRIYGRGSPTKVVDNGPFNAQPIVGQVYGRVPQAAVQVQDQQQKLDVPLAPIISTTTTYHPDPRARAPSQPKMDTRYVTGTTTSTYRMPSTDVRRVSGSSNVGYISNGAQYGYTSYGGTQARRTYAPRATESRYISGPVYSQSSAYRSTMNVQPRVEKAVIQSSRKSYNSIATASDKTSPRKVIIGDLPKKTEKKVVQAEKKEESAKKRGSSDNVATEKQAPKTSDKGERKKSE